MISQYIQPRKILAPILAAVVLTSQLAGCSFIKSQDMVAKLNAGESIEVKFAKGDYAVEPLGTFQSKNLWVQLDSLKTYNDFRMDFDTLFNINKITANGINSKSGCLFVDSKGDQDGNTTMKDAFRNKVFVEKYWNNPVTKNAILKLASKAYVDADGTSKNNIYASLNAYYDILPDNVDPSSFNASQSVTREQFYSMVFKSANGVTGLSEDPSYLSVTGGKTAYSVFAQQVDEKAFLNADAKCLDANNARGSISRAEAVYLVVNNFFGDKLKSADGDAKCYTDCKNAGDLALKAKFKEKKNGLVTTKENWQTYTLAYMMQNPTKGMQEELYKAMVVAHDLGLLGEGVSESRWDEPISKAESIELMANVFIAQNKLDGYLSTVEYGKIDETMINAVVILDDPATLVKADAPGTEKTGANAASGPEVQVSKADAPIYNQPASNTTKKTTQNNTQTGGGKTQAGGSKATPKTDVTNDFGDTSGGGESIGGMQIGNGNAPVLRETENVTGGIVHD